jgi:predicted metal-dependent HD superfamily phosphohydrolase
LDCPKPEEHNSATDFILTLLRTNLPKDLYYHGVHHTLDVCQAVEEIGIAEKVDGESITLLKTAAAFHDCGFVNQYYNNESLAVTCVETHLPIFGYNYEQIQAIAGIILATQVPQRPLNHLQEIICDADLDYLGRDDFFEVSETLKKEWLAYEVISSEMDFDLKQLKFFQQHKYFTRTSTKRRSKQKEKHFIKLQKRCKDYSFK